jgi:hypothetical protein
LFDWIKENKILFIHYFDILIKMRSSKYGVKVLDRSLNLFTYKNCFIGKELVDWIIKNYPSNNTLTREEAVTIGFKLNN